jgi:CheY-like chemotaxis protein
LPSPSSSLLLPSPNKSKKERKRRIILVVDYNEPEAIREFSLALKGRGYILDTFNDPELALLHFKPNFYHLLIIDIKLPDMQEFELCDKIKSIDSKVKVCFLGSCAINYQALRECFPSLSSEIECFIPKPIKIDDLISRISIELGR